MGGILSCYLCMPKKKCFMCYRVYGDYGLDYICHITGKGKYNDKYICFDCIGEKIEKKRKQNEYKTFKDLR